VSFALTDNWFAVYTKPRQEPTALEHLERQGFSCFLPLAMNPYQRNIAVRPKAEPLFPRYLFLNAAPEVQNLSLVRSTRGVVSLVRAGYELLRVPGQIIVALHERRDVESGLIRMDPVALHPGQAVRVFDGPLAGLEGLFLERSGNRRSILLLSILGRETVVEVDSLLLKSA
jgi:transcriptional antiterminator RfaH